MSAIFADNFVRYASLFQSTLLRGQSSGQKRRRKDMGWGLKCSWKNSFQAVLFIAGAFHFHRGFGFITTIPNHSSKSFIILDHYKNIHSRGLFMAPASDSPSSISRKKKIHQSVSSQRADRTTPLTRKIDPRTSQESKSKKIIAAKTFPVAAFEPNKSRNQEGLKRVFREMSSTSIAPPSNDIVLPISLIVPGANPGAYKELETTTIDTSVGFKKEDTQVGKSNFENSVLLTKNKSIELNDDQQTLRKASRVRANVQETGSDTLKSYIKTMANHELLRPEDEAVLGNEIQTQVRWEETRLALEEEILR